MLGHSLDCCIDLNLIADKEIVIIKNVENDLPIKTLREWFNIANPFVTHSRGIPRLHVLVDATGVDQYGDWRDRNYWS